MSENLAEQVIRPSYEQIVGSIRHSGVQEILRRAQEGTLEVTYQTGLAQIGPAPGAGEARGGKPAVRPAVQGQPAPAQTDHKLVGAPGRGKGYST